VEESIGVIIGGCLTILFLPFGRVVKDKRYIYYLMQIRLCI